MSSREAAAHKRESLLFIREMRFAGQNKGERKRARGVDVDAEAAARRLTSGIIASTQPRPAKILLPLPPFSHDLRTEYIFRRRRRLFCSLHSLKPAEEKTEREKARKIKRIMCERAYDI